MSSGFSFGVTAIAARRSPLTKIVSGGQTGVDRAALDAGLAAGLEIGGWCPKDRRAEDGRIPDRYPLTETPARSYAVRTEWNVRDSDGTLVIVLDDVSSGTRLTIDAAQSLSRPVHVQHLAAPSRPGLLSAEKPDEDPVQTVVDWVRRHKIEVLNVAGPRGSSSKFMYPKAKAFLKQVLERLEAPGFRPGRER